MAGADRDGRVAEGDLQVGVADRAAATVACVSGRGAGVRRVLIGGVVGGAVGGWQVMLAVMELRMAGAELGEGGRAPLLSNIYLHRLDAFVEEVLMPEYNRGAERVKNPPTARCRRRSPSS